jgi:hypothetical protein
VSPYVALAAANYRGPELAVTKQRLQIYQTPVPVSNWKEDDRNEY